MDQYQPLLWEVFVVRFQREAPSGPWRGKIIHLPDQATAAFTTWDQAEAFVRRFLPGPGLGPPPQEVET